MAPDIPTDVVDLKVEMVTLPLDAITPYWRNPRENEDAIGAVAASIEAFGYNQPIVVDQDHVIVMGDTRYRALRRLQRTEAKVIVTDLPAKKIKALRIIDNRTHEVADWDPEALRAEIVDDDLSEVLGPYFTTWEMERLQRAVTDPAPTGPALSLVQPTGTPVGTKAPERSAMVEVSCPRCGDQFATPRPE